MAGTVFRLIVFAVELEWIECLGGRNTHEINIAFYHQAAVLNFGFQLNAARGPGEVIKVAQSVFARLIRIAGFPIGPILRGAAQVRGWVIFIVAQQVTDQRLKQGVSFNVKRDPRYAR